MFEIESNQNALYKFIFIAKNCNFHIDSVCFYLVTTSSTNITYKKKSISVKSNARSSTYQCIASKRDAFSYDMMEQWLQVAQNRWRIFPLISITNCSVSKLFEYRVFLCRANFFLSCLERMYRRNYWKTSNVDDLNLKWFSFSSLLYIAYSMIGHIRWLNRFSPLIWIWLESPSFCRVYFPSWNI